VALAEEVRVQKLPENKKIFDLASFIIYKLTREHVIDLTAAQEGGFLDYRTRKWSGDLLSAFDVDDSALPSLKVTTDIVGELKPDAKEKLGAPRGMSIKVNAGCVDAIASLISIGHVKENELSFVVGSTGIIALSTTHPRPDQRLYLDLSPVEGQYLVNGGTAAAGLFFDYVLDLLGVGEPRYARAEELAMRSQAGSRRVEMLPYIYGERTPIFDPLAKSVFFGLTSQVKQGEIIRGSMEAIAFSFLHHIKILKEKGYQYTKIRVTGGATRSNIMLQTLADVMQTELTCYRDVSPTVGNAMIGYIGLGIIKDWTQVERWIGKGETVLPNRTKAAEYSWKFKVYSIFTRS
jgi:xylulokinase